MVSFILNCQIDVITETEMRLKAFHLKQRGSVDETEIYVSSLQASELLERYAIDQWTPENTKGYQRLPQETRFTDARGSILRYLTKEKGGFPTSILVNVRGGLSFMEEQDFGYFSLGELEIDDHEKLWLLDGQHRVEALRRLIEEKEKFRDYPVILSILNLDRKFDELMYFYVVNRRQKVVPMELVYRHLQRMRKEKGEDWLKEAEGTAGLYRARAAEIVDRMNDDPRSPWHGRIRRVTEERRDVHITRDSVLIRVIALMMSNKACSSIPVEDMAGLLIAYWTAISEIYPEAFVEPRDYTLLGPQGITCLHRLFPDILDLCVPLGIITKEGMLSHMKKLRLETPGHRNPTFRPPLELDFWSKEHGPIEAVKTDRESIEELYVNLFQKINIQGLAMPSPA